MDNFAEQLVKNNPTGADRIKNFAMVFIGLFAGIALFGLGILTIGRGIISFLLFLAAIGAGFGTYLLFKNTKIEYEYTFTNGELDIDKIIAQTKRKEMLTISVGKFTAFGKYDAETPEETSDMTVVFATDNIVEHEYYADFPHEAHGSTRLIFVPNEKMISNIIKFLHPSIRNKAKNDIKSSFLSDIANDI